MKCENRQTKYAPKSDTRQKNQTPLSIGLPLSIHKRVCDKSLVNLLYEMHIGSSYKLILDIEKRIETAVVNQMFPVDIAYLVF